MTRTKNITLTRDEVISAILQYCNGQGNLGGRCTDGTWIAIGLMFTTTATGAVTGVDVYLKEDVDEKNRT